MISADLQAAFQRLKGHIEHTPLTFDEKKQLYLKWENRQVTGSFKVRGALNKILSLKAEERMRILVAASAGNHGQAVALAARKVRGRATVFMPATAVPSKVAGTQALGATVKLVPGGYAAAEKAGLEFTRKEAGVWISPYNDEQVIAGQGTLGLEILADLAGQRTGVWVVPAGGGGLASGVGLALENLPQRPKLIAVQAESSPFLHALYHRGTQEGVLDKPTLADGLAGALEDDSLTAELVRRYADDVVLVSEEEIAQAMAFAWFRYGERIEGSAAAALAALLYRGIRERPVVVIITGGNVEPSVHTRVCDEYRHLYAQGASV